MEIRERDKVSVTEREKDLKMWGANRNELKWSWQGQTILDNDDDDDPWIFLHFNLLWPIL